MNYQHIITFESQGNTTDRYFLTKTGGDSNNQAIGTRETYASNQNTVVYMSTTPYKNTSNPQRALVGTLDGTIETFVSRAITDNNLLCAGGPIVTGFRSQANYDELFGFGGTTNRVTVGLNGEFLALFVNGTVVETSSFNMVNPRKTVFVEMLINKTAGTVRVFANADQVIQANVSSFTYDSFRIYLPARFCNSLTTGTDGNMLYEGFYVGSGVNNIAGPMSMLGNYANANPTSQFTGALSTVNNRPFENATFRNSTTAGQQDLYTYNTITLKEDNSASIKFVRHQVIASSDGAGGGQMNLRTRMGGTNYDTSVTSQLVSTTPVLTQVTYKRNPNSLNPWTITDLSSLSNGYVIAP
jgi:hypothetical protein